MLLNKIPTIFQRGPNGLVLEKPNPKCKWVFDADSVMIWSCSDAPIVYYKDNMVYKSIHLEEGEEPPPGWVPPEVWMEPYSDGFLPVYEEFDIEYQPVLDFFRMYKHPKGVYSVIRQGIHDHYWPAFGKSPIIRRLWHTRQAHYRRLTFENLQRILPMMSAADGFIFKPMYKMQFAKILRRDFGLDRIKYCERIPVRRKYGRELALENLQKKI